MGKYDEKTKASEITPPEVYRDRRRFLQWAGGLSLGTAFSGEASAKPPKIHKPTPKPKPSIIPPDGVTLPSYAKHWNNFYEFGTDKQSPAELAGKLITRPWTITVDGEVHNPKVFDIDHLRNLAALEERIYRLRCVEAWSMTIPWLGYPLAKLIDLVQPTGNAKFVEFTTLYRPSQMPGQRGSELEWPYVEGLRLDEAMHPLTLLTFGMYGKVLPNQNGAPVRLVVPWKYGFKSAKSLVRIRLLEYQPIPTWMRANPTTYGFYANVNPSIDVPWSQANEYHIGQRGEITQRPTKLFNGYATQVANLYAGMNLRRYF